MVGEIARSTVLIVDESELRRTLFASAIERWADIENLVIEHIAPSEMSAFASLHLEVKLVVLSVGEQSLKEGSVRDMIATIGELFPGKACSVISDRREAEEAVMAARLGVQAFLPTRMDIGAFCRALTFVLSGGTIFPREALLYAALSVGKPDNSSATLESDQGILTRRQTEVLGELGLGKSNKLIAHKLKLHESTVKVHVRAIMRKLGASNRTQAALIGTSLAHTGPRQPTAR